MKKLVEFVRELRATIAVAFCPGCFGTGHVGCERCARHYRPKDKGGGP